MKAQKLFAAGTAVPIERSRAEIEKMLVRYGATAFSSSWDATRASFGFAYEGWHVRFSLDYPKRDEERFTKVPGRWSPRSETEQAKLYDAEIRRLWRALVLLTKAKLECVTSGISTFEKEFLAHIVLPNSNETIGEYAIPKLEMARKTPGGFVTPIPQLKSGSVS